MPGMRPGPNQATHLVIDDIPLMLATGPYNNKRPPFVLTTLVPLKPGTDEFQVKVWQNGEGPGSGAGWTRETPKSAAAGGYAHLQNGTSQTPGIVMPAGRLEQITLPGSITTQLYDSRFYNGDLWISTAGRYLLNLASGTATTATTQDLGSGFQSQSLCVFDGNLLVSGAGSGSIWSFNGSAFSQGTSVTRSRLDKVYWVIGDQLSSGGASGTAGTGAFRLIGTDADGTGFYHLATGSNPLVAANWSSLIPITKSPYTIQQLIVDNHTVWFGTTGGVYACDGLGYAPNLSPWAEYYWNASNGGACLYKQGYILYGHTHGLAMIPTTGERQDTPVWIQFGEGQANGTPVYGRPHHMADAGHAVYVAYGDAGSTYIMALKLTADGPLWSGPERYISGETPTMLSVESLGGRPYLMIGTSASGTPKLYRQSLPITGSAYADHLQNTAHQFETDWKATLSKWDLNDSSPKEVHQYEIVTENLGAGKSVTVNVSTDGAAYVSQGVATTSPREVILPEESASAGTDVQIRLDCTNTADDPVVVRLVGARMSVQPEPIEILEYTVLIAEGQELLNTSTNRQRDPKADLRAVLGLPKRGTVTATDQFGDTLRLRIRSILEARVHEETKGKPWSAVVTFKGVVIDRTVLYDNSELYDSGTPYGA